MSLNSFDGMRAPGRGHRDQGVDRRGLGLASIRGTSPCPPDLRALRLIYVHARPIYVGAPSVYAHARSVYVGARRRRVSAAPGGCPMGPRVADRAVGKNRSNVRICRDFPPGAATKIGLKRTTLDRAGTEVGSASPPTTRHPISPVGRTRMTITRAQT